MTSRRVLFLDRLVEHIDFTPDCWVWTGNRHEAGYGRIMIDRVLWRAHRAVYEATVGPIPDGLHIDHLCRNRACVNPDHLEPVTEQVNILRGVSPHALNARKTHCQEGHPFAGDNLLLWADGKRRCRICMTERNRQTTARRRAAREAT